MAITLECQCGRTLRLRDELAGKKVRCPECRTFLAVRTAGDSGDVFGGIDFDELAELERNAPSAKLNFNVECPRCQTVFTTKAASEDARTSCGSCGESFRIGDYPLSKSTFGLPVNAGKAERCAKCLRSIEPGQGLCDLCARGMAADVERKHEAEAREHRQNMAKEGRSAFDRMGLTRIFGFLSYLFGRFLGAVFGSLFRR